MARILRQSTWDNDSLRQYLYNLIPPGTALNSYNDITHWYIENSFSGFFLYVRVILAIDFSGEATVFKIYRFPIGQHEAQRIEWLFHPQNQLPGQESIHAAILVLAFAKQEYEKVGATPGIILPTPTRMEGGHTDMSINAKNTEHMALMTRIPSLNSDKIQTFAWKCSCIKAFFCDTAVEISTNSINSGWDINNISEDKFVLLLPILQSVLHRVTVTRSIATNWDGTEGVQYEFATLVCSQEISRYYAESDWLADLVSPGQEINDWLVGELDTNQDARILVDATLCYMNDGIRVTGCTSKTHNLVTNKKLLDRLKKDDKAVRANAFCLLHYSMCIICTDSNELALSMMPDSF